MRPSQQFGDDVADEDLSAARAKGILWPGVVTMLRGSAQRRGAAIVAAVTGIINGTTMVLGATAIGWTTDNFIVPSFTTGAIEAGALWTAVVFILGVSTFRWSTILIRGMATGRVQFWAQASTRRDITRQYQKLDLSWHRKHSPGQLLANTVSDVEAMWNPMQFFYFAVGMVVMLVIAVVNLFLLDPSMGVIGLVLITAVLGINVLYQRVIAGRARAAQQARAGVAQVAHESFEGEQVVRTLGLEARENERFAARVDRLRDANTRMGYVSAVFDPLLELLPTASVLVVLGVGSAQVAEGGLSVGVLVEIIYLLLTISLPLNIISRFLAVLPMSAVGAERTRAVLTSTEFTRFGDRTWGGRGAPAVSVRSASFSLGGHSVLRDIDVDIAAGEVVALVGATGAGKSSLVGIIARLVDPDSGAVCFDGVPAVELAEGQLSTHVAVAPQEVFLFDDTVRANVTLGGPPGANPQSGAVADEGAIPDYSDDQVWDALRLAGADKFVEQLPEGINTPLGQRGSSLSGGQRQRISLARALIRKPALLILDDATSALDPEVEREVLGNIAALTTGDGTRAMTVVIVAYRKTSIAFADRVLLLSDGRLVASGRHAQLARDNGEYRALVNAYDGTIGAAEGAA